MLRDLDEQASRLVDVDQASIERAAVQVKLGLVGLEIVLELDQSRVPFLEHDLHLENVAVEREESEDHVCWDSQREVGDDQDPVRLLALLVQLSVSLERVAVGVRGVDREEVKRLGARVSWVGQLFRGEEG